MMRRAEHLAKNINPIDRLFAHQPDAREKPFDFLANQRTVPVFPPRRNVSLGRL
jgi:hypothetical protein